MFVIGSSYTSIYEMYMYLGIIFGQTVVLGSRLYFSLVSPRWSALPIGYGFVDDIFSKLLGK